MWRMSALALDLQRRSCSPPRHRTRGGATLECFCELEGQGWEDDRSPGDRLSTWKVDISISYFFVLPGKIEASVRLSLDAGADC
jgi:hypothetical protein